MIKHKVLVVINDLRIGGAQKLVVDSLKYLNRNQFEFELLVLSDSKTERTFLTEVPEDVPTTTINFNGFSDIASWYKSFKFLRRSKPEVVWSHLYFSNTVTRILKPLIGYKVIAVEHNTYLNRRFSQRLLNRILALFTYRIVAVAPFVANFTSESEKIPFKKFAVITNGVDLDLFLPLKSRLQTLEQLGFSREDKILINIGQCINQKNQEMLIEAFSKNLHDFPEWRLLILGDGPLRNKMLEEVSKKNISDKIFIPGIKTNVSDYLSVSEGFVLSSRFEGFPIVAIEALASGLPIISTPVSGSELYVKETNGLLVEDSVESLSIALNKFMSLSDLERSSMSKSSLEIVQSFNIREVAHRYEELFLYASKR